jgi:hypothetical protein
MVEIQKQWWEIFSKNSFDCWKITNVKKLQFRYENRCTIYKKVQTQSDNFMRVIRYTPPFLALTLLFICTV